MNLRVRGKMKEMGQHLCVIMRRLYDLYRTVLKKIEIEIGIGKESRKFSYIEVDKRH